MIKWCIPQLHSEDLHIHDFLVFCFFVVRLIYLHAEWRFSILKWPVSIKVFSNKFSSSNKVFWNNQNSIMKRQYYIWDIIWNILNMWYGSNQSGTITNPILQYHLYSWMPFKLIPITFSFSIWSMLVSIEHGFKMLLDSFNLCSTILI